MYAVELGKGRWFDGQSALPHSVEVTLRGSDLHIKDLSDTSETERVWKLRDIRHLRRHAESGRATFMAHPVSDERLVLDDFAPSERLERLTGPLKETEGHGKGYLRRVFIWAGAAVGSVYLILFVLVPWLAIQMARLIPYETERQIGQAALEQIEWLFLSEGALGACDSPEGLAAVETMVARLEPHFESETPVEVVVRDISVPNAFAVPGGTVVLFRGLIDMADSPEMVAGVLGHEIGHVVHRHPLAAALRAAGSAGVLGLVFGDFSGGTVALLISERLISAKYAQSAEREADAFALETLRAANLSGAALAEFFDRISEEFGEDSVLLSHISSHPGLAERAERARADSIAEDAAEPILGKKGWQALRDICN